MIFEGNRYEFLVNSATASQTFVESTRSVKTLHSPNTVDDTFTTKKSIVNVSFMVYLSKTGVVERSIFDWFDFKASGPNHVINPVGIEVSRSDIYIEANGSIYRIVNCVGGALSFKLANTEILSLEVTAQGGNMEEVPSIPETGSLVTQVGNRGFYNASVSVDNYPLLNAITCEVSRDISWTKQQTTHDIGSIFVNNLPILKSLSISGTITQYKTDDSNSYNPSNSITITYGDTFTIHLDDCNTTDRWAMQNIHMKQIDYKLLPSNANSYIKF